MAFQLPKDSIQHKLFLVFKWTVYILLSYNCYLFFTESTFYEGLDSAAWIALLFLFEWETNQLEQISKQKLKIYSLHILRIISYFFVVYAAIGYSSKIYTLENGYLDMYNAWLWIAVVIVLEYDVWVPGYYRKWEWWLRNTLKSTLYIGLIAIAVIWGFSDEGSVLDFYDAVLWILCFFVIEMNIFQFEDEIPYQEEINENPELAKQFDDKVN